MKAIYDILENWVLGTILEIKKLPKATVNTIFQILTKKNSFILKISNLDEKIDHSLEFEYLEYLDRKKFPYFIPQPIKTKKNLWFVEKDQQIYWIYKYIPGFFISDFNSIQISEIGKLIGIYHQTIYSSNFHLGHISDKKYPYTFNLEDIYTHLDLINEKTDQKTADKEYLNFSDPLIAVYNSINHNRIKKMEFYRIHRDINPENLIWDKDRLIGLVDFENVNSHYDPLLKGLSVCLTTCCRLRKSFKPNFEYFNILLANYKKFNNDIDIEIDLLVDFILEGLIEDYNYVYWLINNSPDKVNNLSMNYYKEALEWYRDHSERVISKLLEFQ